MIKAFEFRAEIYTHILLILQLDTADQIHAAAVVALCEIIS